MPNFTKDLELPRVLKLKHGCPNRHSTGFSSPIGNHEDMQQGFIRLFHGTSLPEARSPFIR